MKKIVVATSNKSKIEAVKALFSFCNIVCEEVDSLVSSKPINNETILGAYNRCNQVKQPADIVVAIEGGYFKVGNKYYLCDVCCIKDADGYKFGNGPLFTISKNMYDCAKQGVSLNMIIKQSTGYNTDSNEFKQNQGVVGYLSQNKYDRNFGNICAAKCAINTKHSNVNSFVIDKNVIINLAGPAYDDLDSYCKNYLTLNQGL